MRLAIVGARTFSDQATFDDAITDWIVCHGRMPDEVVSGDARGADTMGKAWAAANRIPYVGYPVDWHSGPSGAYDATAALRRNSDIVARCTHMLAFPSVSGSGTQDAIRKAQAAGRDVVVVPV